MVKSKGNQPPVRRIYIGDVPSIYDDQEFIPTLCHSNRCFMFPSSKIESDDNGPTTIKPVPVQRQSMHSDQPPQVEKFPDNAITTSRVCFLFYYRNIETFVSPLTFVVMVTAVKQGYEDWLRHKNDDQVNNRAVRVVRNGVMLETKSKDIHVGDIVKLEKDEQVPTDILLLGSSDDFLRCYINTANLDGETNLKLRYCPSALPRFRTPEDFHRLHVIVECEHPCEDLYEFSGSLLLPADKLNEMHWSPTESMVNVGEGRPMSKNEHIERLKTSGLVRQGITDFIAIPLSMENMVLRGTRLKNTDFIYGLVIYTGLDTRLARNSQKPQAKFSTVERAVNVYLVFFIALLLLMVIFCSAMHYCVNWNPPGTEDSPWYIESKPKPESKEIFNTVASFLILYNYIIPISLYVTIELQKFLGSKFFVWDNEMVDEEGKEPLCNTSDLNEELGQIEYLFSDKTGTLTQNVMQFRHCSIEAARYELRSGNLYHVQNSSYNSEDTSVGHVNVVANKNVLQFFSTLALCHSVQVVTRRRPSFDVRPISSSMVEIKINLGHQRKNLVTPEPSKNEASETSTEYQASSPDEKALVESCEKSIGNVYVGEKEDIMTLNTCGVTEKYKRLMQLEFDADRKCMSVIIENSNGEIWLLTKGAESSIIPKCDNGPTEETLTHVMEFALMGLRTLVVANRKLTQEEYEKFIVDLRAARRQIKNRQEKVRGVYSSIESHMTLLGATGVEDQLQEHVPETLQSFAAAGIRVWMLTGDKLETGVNVAVSCGLITASTKQYILKQSSSPFEIRSKLAQFKEQIDPNDNTCFVIDGESLGIGFKECPDLLRDVSMAATRVVCCRMAPLQKAQVVQMVKNSKRKPTCCAVGDGANDCAMILAAHIGIGILGKEGRQAARCADFALAKFGYLRRAILVHGHWYYVRLANLANYFFYKNIVFVFPQFFFSFNSSFSTQAVFNGLFLMNYNIFFSSCPIFYYGLTEQPYSAENLLKYPHLYRENRRNLLMSMKIFIPWLVSGFWHASVCYYLPFFSWNNFDHMNDGATFGTIVFIAVLIAVNVKSALETKYLTWWYLGSQVFSYGTFFLITSVYSEVNLDAIALDAGDFEHVFFNILRSVNFWLLIILIPIVTCLPDLTITVLKQSLNKRNDKEYVKTKRM